MNADEIKLVTDNGSFILTVDGDCCSSSYFHDFIGVKKLLNNKIVKIEEVEIDDDGKRTPRDDEELEFYGYSFISVHPEFGEVSSVFSFRNSSNGYYGGWLNKIEESDREILPEIFDDYWVNE